MKRIRYNIASHKKVHYGKFVFYTFFLVLFAGGLIFLGIRNLWSSDQREALQKEQARQDRLRVEELTRKSADYEEQIKLSQKKWRRQYTFALQLIEAKNFDIIERLDMLEESLPEGVMITHVAMDAEKDTSLIIQVAAESLERLVDTYEIFKSHGVEVRGEKEKEGMFNATLYLRYKGSSPKNIPDAAAPASAKKDNTDGEASKDAKKGKKRGDSERELLDVI